MISRIFLKHPRSVDETYLEHMVFALRFAVLLFAAGLAAFVHALVPCCFEKTASSLVAKLYEKTRNRMPGPGPANSRQLSGVTTS